MLLSIVVLSYNRPEQIKRILENLLEAPNSEFNLIIKDDQSPKREEIHQIVEHYQSSLKFEVIFHSNRENLGYDRNLLDSFSITNSDYIFFLSDDDYILGEKIPDLLALLRKKEFSVYFSPYTSKGKINRQIKSKYYIGDFSNIIYNSVLFSGLIFDREKVNHLQKDIDFLSNCIYSQVYLSSLLVFNEKSYGVAPIKLLVLGDDGENYFGKNPSATNSDILMDRESILSNLNYQVFLLTVVKVIASDTNALIYKIFVREYKKRLIAYAFKARASGKIVYRSFLSHYEKSDLPNAVWLSFLLKCFYLIPDIISKYIYNIGITLFRKSG